MPSRAKVPASASRTPAARGIHRLTRHGRIVRMRRTRPSASSQATSIGNRIPTVWTELTPGSHRAPSIPLRPSRPRPRARRVEAISISTPPGCPLDVEEELHRVAVLDDVLLALDPDLAGRLGLGPRTQL